MKKGKLYKFLRLKNSWSKRYLDRKRRIGPNYVGGGHCTMLCTVCRKTQARRTTCCGKSTLALSPMLEVPKMDDKKGWKRFLKLFPRYA